MTDATGFDLLLYKILMVTPGAPDTLVSSVLQDVILDFYKKSTGLRVDIGPIAMVAQQDTYDLNESALTAESGIDLTTESGEVITTDAPAGSLLQVLYVLGTYLFPSTVGGNSRRWLDPQVRKVMGTDTGVPVTWFTPNPTRLVLYPTPDQNYGAQGMGLYVYAICMPTPGTAFPAITTVDHLDALQYGTLARLLAFIKRPWSNPPQALQYERLYKKEIMRVRDMANRAYGGADSPLRFPRFAGPGSQGIMSGSTAVAR